MNLNKHLSILLIVLLVSLSGIAQINPQFDPIPANYGTINSPNPVYALDMNYDNIDTKQIFHLFLPDTTGNFPLVAYIHGGGYISGTPNTVFQGGSLQEIKYCLENGIAYASFGYRLINNNGPDNEGVIKC